MPENVTPLVGGRLPPITRGLRLSAGDFMRAGYHPPAFCDYTLKPRAWLHQILDNDTLSDCTLAAALHIAGSMFANNDEPIPFKISDARDIYFTLTGGKDTGLYETQVLDYWLDKGIAGHKAACWVTVDAGNMLQAKSAIGLFENLYIGGSIPDAWVADGAALNDGFVLALAGKPNDKNGHCMAILGYGPRGVIVSTWGRVGWITWEALAFYFTPKQNGDCFTVFAPDWISKISNKAPNGFDVNRLLATIDGMRAAA